MGIAATTNSSNNVLIGFKGNVSYDAGTIFQPLYINDSLTIPEKKKSLVDKIVDECLGEDMQREYEGIVSRYAKQYPSSPENQELVDKIVNNCLGTQQQNNN